jgi:hypothetical protein
MAKKKPTAKTTPITHGNDTAKLTDTERRDMAFAMREACAKMRMIWARNSDVDIKAMALQYETLVGWLAKCSGVPIVPLPPLPKPKPPNPPHHH